MRRISLWRVGAPLALLCAGLLFATSATNARGTDLRPSRNTTLAGLVEEQSRRSATLVRQHAALTRIWHRCAVAVAATSRGIPRTINILCDTALVYGFASEVDAITAEIIGTVVQNRAQFGVIPFDLQPV